MFKEVDNKIWQEDIEFLINDEIFDSYENSTFLITGATGFIGSWLVLALLCANRIKGLNNKVVAFVRNEEKAKKIFKNVINDSNFELVVQDVCEQIICKNKVDYIIHCANITTSKMMIENPMEVVNTTLIGTKNILDFAKDNNIKNILYLSSLEIYGAHKDKKEDIKEDDYGELDSKLVRNCYPISKKMAENICAIYSFKYDLNIKIARLTQTFGSGISLNDNRVFAQFAKSIIKNNEIILKTDGLSYKNYCYITDTISALLYIIQKGQKGEIYNVANYNSAITIKDLALKLIEKYKKSSLSFDIDEKSPYLNNVYLKLNSEKLENLGWNPKISLDEMFDKLIEYLKIEGV